MKRIHIITIFLLICASVAAQPKTLSGRAYNIYDGDTFILMDKEGHKHKIRLDGIDCPEFKQSFGQKARGHLFNLISGKKVTVKYTQRDKYHRVLGTVFLGEQNINETMVADGYAWHFTRFNHSQRLADLEKRARESKLGLWAEPNPTPPWEFRDEH